MNVERLMIVPTFPSIIDTAESIPNGASIWCVENKRLYFKIRDKLIAVSDENLKDEAIHITAGKRTIRALTCQKCGAPLKISDIGSITVCQYCRTFYVIDEFDIEGVN